MFFFFNVITKQLGSIDIPKSGIYQRRTLSLTTLLLRPSFCVCEYKKRFIYLIWMDTPYWLKRQPTFHLNRCNTKNGMEKKRNVSVGLVWHASTTFAECEFFFRFTSFKSKYHTQNIAACAIFFLYHTVCVFGSKWFVLQITFEYYEVSNQKGEKIS